MMVNWTCPHCGKRMYSSWERKNKRKVKCIYCHRKFNNPYYKTDSVNRTSNCNFYFMEKRSFSWLEYIKGKLLIFRRKMK